MSEDLTGRRLGHYRIDAVLGKGGMSVMYRATDMRLGRKVALKVIAEHLTEDPEFRERFVDEARNTSAIDHANVVPLYDFGEVDGLLYIAMRLVDGPDLASLIRKGPLAPARTLALLSQVAEALDNLHERGLVHLDVKPANVLVTTREAAGEHVYVADFGLTRRGATGHRTRAGDFLGSPTYAAPEHLRGEPVDGRTDAYSLACVLFACLAGRPPFRGQVPEVIQGHLHRQPPRLTDLVVLPTAIDEVILRGLAKTPHARYRTCRELMAAARRALATVPRPGAVPERRGPEGTLPVTVQVSSAEQGHGGTRLPGPTSTPLAGPPPPLTEPVRLRPPVPARSAAFTADHDRPRWLAPVLVGLLAIGLIVAAIVYLSAGERGRDGGDERVPDPSMPSTPALPSIKVGPASAGQSSSAPSSGAGERRIPSLPVRPSLGP